MTTPPQGSGDEGGSDANGGQPGQSNQDAWQQPKQQSGQDAWQQPDGQANQDAWQQSGRQPGPNAWQQPGQGSGWQQPGQHQGQPGPQPGQQPTQQPSQPGQNTWQQPAQQHGQQPSQQHGQPPGPQTGQPVHQGQNTWQQPGQQGGWQQTGQAGHQQPGRQSAYQQPGQPGAYEQQPGQQAAYQQPGKQAQGGWGQTAALPAQDAYQSWAQQPWGGQQSQPLGDWQQQPWQPPGGGGDDNRKMLMIIGGGVVGVLVLGLLIFLGVRALGGGDDEAGPTVETSGQPTGQPTDQPSGQPSDQPSGQPTDVGNSTGQAKAATDALAAQGYECADLFNTPQGGHRGCFRSAGTTDAEVIFQFSPDGTVIGMQVYSYDTENTNTARKAFDGALTAIGGQAFSQEIPKVQAAVNGGQKHTDVKLGWGELRLSNNGDSLRLTGGKNGTDALEVPRKQFDNNETAFKAALKAKGYQCPSYCKKGGYGTGQASTYVNAYGSSDSGLRSVTVDSSGDGNAARTAFSASATDVMSILKGDDVAALQAWVKAHVDGKSHSSYVNGWRVELSARMGSSGYGDIELEIKNESYYV